MMQMLCYAVLEDAETVAAAWDAVPQSLAHIGDSGNAVFSFRTREGVRRILRLVDVTFRSEDEVRAELYFLAHLQSHNAPAAAGVRNRDGEFTLPYASARGEFVVSVLEYADGVRVTPESEYWGDNFFRAWGRNLALLHRASETYAPPPTVPRLWQWDAENLWRRAPGLIPAEDNVTQGALEHLFRRVRALERTRETFGVIHADLGPQNFHYQPALDTITAFDFGNACYHWFSCDVAIAVSTLRLQPKRDEIKRELLAGYTGIRPLPADFESELGLFLRLRTLYVYLARLLAFGLTPDARQQRILDDLRARIRVDANAETAA